MYKQRLRTHNAHASRHQIWLVRQGRLNVADLRGHKNFWLSVGGQELKTIAGIYFD